MRSLQEDVASAIGIAVEVHNSFLFQLVDVRLDPLGGTERTRLFAIPDAINDGAAGLPPLLDQFAERAGFFEFGGGAGDWIVGAVDPGVVMVAADDPLIGRGAAGNFGDDVVEGLDVPVGEHLQMNLGCAGSFGGSLTLANVVGEGQAAAPGCGRYAAADGREERGGVGVGDGQDGNLGDDGGVFDIETLGVLGGSDAGG